MRTQTIEFSNDANVALNGIVHHAPGETRALAVFAHCFTCTARSKAAAAISRGLAQLGITTMRFDFTGLGESDGEFAQSNFSTNVTDIKAAVEALEQLCGMPVELLVGHSLGGTAVLAAAAGLPRVRAVATLGAPARPEHVGKLVRRSTVAEHDDALEINLGGRPFKIGRQLFDDLAAHSNPAAFADLRAAILVMHAPLDAIVEISNATEIFVNAKHSKSFVSLDHADHLLSDVADARYAAEVISTWSQRYLSRQDAALPAEDSAATAQTSDADAVAVTRAGSLVTSIDVGGHRLIADEPADVGGDNLGAAPTRLLSAALAACTSMTLQIYARHKGLALESVKTQVRQSKEAAETGDGKEKVSVFERVIELRGELDDAQRARMIEIAERCPVHRTLGGAVRFETRES